jgi:hypothetical protein
MTDLALMEAFVGRWRSRGRTAASAAGPGMEIAGTDVYEWFPGRRFLVHHVDVMMGTDHVRALEMIGGATAGDEGLPMRSFHNNGDYGQMRASRDDRGVWTFTDGAIRSTVTFGADGQTMAARWERTEGGAWQHWMDMAFTRET